MPTTLTSQNAIVRTATVEIKTMSIGNKQVTLAVFRQLKEELVIDLKTGGLHGVPWGIVNYFWGDCQTWPHLHVVWQKGTELRRCCMSSRCYSMPSWKSGRWFIAFRKARPHLSKEEAQEAYEQHLEMLTPFWEKHYDAIAKLDQLFIAV
jgi:hypothetical protein